MADRTRGLANGLNGTRRSRIEKVMQALGGDQDDFQSQTPSSASPLEVSGSGHDFAARSEGPSEMSSSLFRPRWLRLLQAAAQVLASQVQHSDAGLCSGASPGAGGGTEKDITDSLKASLEALELSDEDTGLVLVSAYHFLQEGDLVVSAASWRCLTTVALMAAVRSVTQGSPQGLTAETKVRDSVAHWWPPLDCEAAYRAFTAREGFEARLTPAVRAHRYFELRDRALQNSYDSESVASAVRSFSAPSDPGAERGTAASGRPRPGLAPPRRAAGGHLDTSSRSSGSGRSGGNLLEYSDAESSGSWGSRGAEEARQRPARLSADELIISI